MKTVFTSPREFLNWLVSNQFLAESHARALRQLPAALTDNHTFAKALLDRNWLTPYQVNKILQGKGRHLIVGPYRLVQKLGAGAMGEVFKCWSHKLAMFVALKMIHKVHLTSKKAMDRFFREMETAGKLDHPNIVLLRDADAIDDRPYMVMNYVDGIDLSRKVKRDGPLSVAAAVSFVRQAALGLEHAFQRGVVHRDIKPGNLLVTRDAAPLVKISDFGLARFESENGSEGRLTQAGAVLGTVDYIAPEQAQNARQADIRADIYSLGCTLFYLLTAQPPFSGESIVEKVSARLTGDLADPRSYRADIPAGLVAVLQRMTKRRPAERLQAPREVAMALEPYCMSLPS